MTTSRELLPDVEWLRDLSGPLFSEDFDRIERIADSIEFLQEWLAKTQMLAFKWMEAHDKLKAGKPYDFPKPADLPDTIESLQQRIKQLTALVGRAYVEGHNRARANPLVHQHSSEDWAQSQSRRAVHGTPAPSDGGVK